MNDAIALMTAIFDLESCVRVCLELDLGTIHPFVTIKDDTVNIHYYAACFPKKLTVKNSGEIKVLLDTLNSKTAAGQWLVDKEGEEDMVAFFAQWRAQDICVSEVIDTLNMLIETNQMLVDVSYRLATME